MASGSVKRIMAELKSMRENPDPTITASPLEGNVFEWHFTIAGPPDSDYTGGVYHGRIILPPEYPFRPPNVVLLTPNGRWEVGTKICLNASGFHPEEWQPSWSIKTLLVALVAFMTTNGEGAIGAVEVPAPERRRLAVASRTWKCPRCGMDHADFASKMPVASSPSPAAPATPAPTATASPIPVAPGATPLVPEAPSATPGQREASPQATHGRPAAPDTTTKQPESTASPSSEELAKAPSPAQEAERPIPQAQMILRQLREGRKAAAGAEDALQAAARPPVERQRERREPEERSRFSIDKAIFVLLIVFAILLYRRLSKQPVSQW